MKENENTTKPSLKLQAYQYLKTKILNCEYAPSQFLNEQKLCAEMGNISRTPMRDALGRLEQGAWQVRTPTCKTFRFELPRDGACEKLSLPNLVAN